jgi:hypothetical protein
MNERHRIGLMRLTSVALMAGLMWLGGATPGAFALVGLGAAVMAAVCAISEF